MSDAPTVIAVVGPTGVGKSRLGEDLARELHGEIVSADSMQVYRGMDIGTAKVEATQRTVPYHCLDLVDPGEPFSAALFQVCARDAIEDITSRGRVPVLVGGTGLYVRAALDDMQFPHGEQISPSRQHYEDLAREMGSVALHDLLRDRDPASAAVIHPNNVRRTIRALEMADQGVSYAEQRSGFTTRESVYGTVFLGMCMKRELLYERINERVDRMVESGLLDEIRELLESGFRDALTSSQAIGYKEFIPVLEEGADLSAAVEEVKRSTRRYAKRQLTWFRGDERIHWIDVTELSPAQTLDQALGLIESSTSTSAESQGG